MKASEVTKQDMSFSRKALKELKATELSLSYPRLDQNSLGIEVYSGTSFATNWDISSQLRYIVFVKIKDGKHAPLHWNS